MVLIINYFWRKTVGIGIFINNYYFLLSNVIQESNVTYIFSSKEKIDLQWLFFNIWTHQVPPQKNPFVKMLKKLFFL